MFFLFLCKFVNKWNFKKVGGKTEFLPNLSEFIPCVFSWYRFSGKAGKLENSYKKKENTLWNLTLSTFQGYVWERSEWNYAHNRNSRSRQGLITDSIYQVPESEDYKFFLPFDLYTIYLHLNILFFYFFNLQGVLGFNPR